MFRFGAGLAQYTIFGALGAAVTLLGTADVIALREHNVAARSRKVKQTHQSYYWPGTIEILCLLVPLISYSHKSRDLYKDEQQ